MAAITICFTSPPSLSMKTRAKFTASTTGFVCCSVTLPSSVHFAAGKPQMLCLGAVFFRQRNILNPSSSPFSGRSRRARICTALAVVDEEAVIAKGVNGEENMDQENNGVSSRIEEESNRLGRPCEIYVCNIPRSCDETKLLEMFRPYGTVVSVEVCRNGETGESRGCGYIIMASINSAKKAVTALDGSDVGRREMRVKFSVEMNRGRRNPEIMNSSPQKVFCYETPHKLYVGNLAKTVQPAELKKLFNRFGTVVSVRILHDIKAGKSRIFGFLSFLSEVERDAAMSLHGMELHGRNLVVRKGVERTEI